MDNMTISEKLLEAAHTLEATQANFYRVRAYRRAAQVIRGLDRPVENILSDAGRKALRELPGIGVSLSSRIETLVRTGEFPSLNTNDDKVLVAV